MPIRLAICAAAIVVVAAGCGGGDDVVESNAQRFCGEAIENRSNLVAPPLTTDAEIAATLEFYRLMGELAPIGIAAEWNDVVVSLETASTLVPGDPESEQIVAKTAYAAEPSAFAVKTWLQENCGLDIPITTIAPQEAVPARTTTTSIAPPDTTVADSG